MSITGNLKKNFTFTRKCPETDRPYRQNGAGGMTIAQQPAIVFHRDCLLVVVRDPPKKGAGRDDAGFKVTGYLTTAAAVKGSSYLLVTGPVFGLLFGVESRT